MTVSPTKLIGSVVQRTLEALNADPAFVEAAKAYAFWPNCSENGRLRLRHSLGTPTEIADTLAAFTPPADATALNLPAVLDIHPVRQIREVGGGMRPENRIVYNLAIVAPARREWPTGQQEQEVFETILRPIGDELIRQIKRSPAFATGYELEYDCYEVFATGEASGGSDGEGPVLRYGDAIDAIEIRNLTLSLRPDLCEKTLNGLYAESDQVTVNINHILNQQEND